MENQIDFMPGDRLQVDRGPYSHFAIYAGNDEVIHKTTINNGPMPHQSAHVKSISGTMFDKTEVRRDKLSALGERKDIRVNNKRDKSWKPFKPEEIVERADRERGPSKYNVLTSNCEHFANKVRYGEEKSDQSENGIIIGGTSLGIILTGILAIAAGFGIYKYKQQKQSE